MAGVDIHGDVWQIELLEGICDTITVAGGRVLAGLLVGVCDEVGERIGLDDEGDGGVGVLLEDGDDGWEFLATHSCREMKGSKLTVDVLALVGGEVSGSELTVRGLSCAVTAGKVVDDESGKLVARNVLEVVFNDRDTGTSVTIK